MDSYVVMKTIREGCLNAEKGNDLSTAPSINGEARDKDTEVTGEMGPGGTKW